MRGYQAALEAVGCHVVEYWESGDYQGTWLALIFWNEGYYVAEGCYGSCSGCDAFQAEFGWGLYEEEETPEYKEKLRQFGMTYMPPYTFEEKMQLSEKNMLGDDYVWQDDRAAHEKLKEWQKEYNINKQAQ